MTDSTSKETQQCRYCRRLLVYDGKPLTLKCPGCGLRYLVCSGCKRIMEYDAINRQFYCTECRSFHDFIGPTVEKESTKFASWLSRKIVFWVSLIGLVLASYVVLEVFFDTENNIIWAGCCISSFIIAVILASTVGAHVKKRSYKAVSKDVIEAIPFRFRCPDCGIPFDADHALDRFSCKVCRGRPKEDIKPSTIITEWRIARCTVCGQSLAFIEQHNRWFCRFCKQYR